MRPPQRWRRRVGLALWASGAGLALVQAMYSLAALNAPPGTTVAHGPLATWAVHLLPAARAAAEAVPPVAQPVRTPPVRAATPAAHDEAPLVLLGEVHDNAVQHALRLRALEALIESGARPALLMEQFDRERQPDIEAVRADARAVGEVADADRLIAAASSPGTLWRWEHYRPFIRLALHHGLPIVAANVSRSDARRVSAQGLAALGFDASVPDDIASAQQRLIVAAHCGMVDEAQGRRMAGAQIARDQFMARLIGDHRQRGAVLLAGNGHVRRDIGVPRWLDDETRSRVKVVGLLEEGDDSHRAYDLALTTPRQPREDPCAGMRPIPPLPAKPATPTGV